MKEVETASVGMYEESLHTERIAIPQSPATELATVPGQSHRKTSTWDPEFDKIQDGKVRGIIIVDSYGYHSPGELSIGETKLLTKSFQDYLADGQKQELANFREICSRVKQARNPIWILHIINKQDLWFEDQDQVKEHFRSESFRNIIEEVSNAKDSRHFRYEIVYSSLAKCNLVTSDGSVLAYSSQEYDQLAQQKSCKALIDAFRGLMKWESEANV